MKQSGKSNAEKRKHKRLPAAFIVMYTVRIPFTVRIIIGNSDCSAVAQDIAEEGMALLASFEIPVGALLSLRFDIINDAVSSRDNRRHSFELDAQVRNSRLVRKNTYRLGVSFVNILPAERAFIADYIKVNTLIRNPKP